MNILTETAIVLRKQPYGDADEILTLLSHQKGLFKIFAKGSRRSKKRYQGLLEVFGHGRFHFRERLGGLASLVAVDGLNGEWRMVMQALEAFGLCQLLSELTEQFLPEESGDQGLYELWMNLMTELCDKGFEGSRALHHLIHFMDCVGYPFDWTRCWHCGRELDQEDVVVLRGGSAAVVCASCVSEKEQKAGLPLKFWQDNEGQDADAFAVTDFALRHALDELINLAQGIMQKKARAAAFFLSLL